MTNNLFQRLDLVIGEKLNGNWAELARITGFNPSTLQGIKEGKDPRGSTLLRISEALNVSIDWLLTGQGSMHRNAVAESGEDTLSSRHTALLQLFDALEDDQQREILTTAQEKERLNKMEVLLDDLLKKVG